MLLGLYPFSLRSSKYRSDSKQSNNENIKCGIPIHIDPVVENEVLWERRTKKLLDHFDEMENSPYLLKYKKDSEISRLKKIFEAFTWLEIQDMLRCREYHKLAFPDGISKDDYSKILTHFCMS